MAGKEQVNEERRVWKRRWPVGWAARGQPGCGGENREESAANADVRCHTECLNPGVKREPWAGNGDLRVMSVDTGIETMSMDGASREGTWFEKSRGQGWDPREEGTGEQDSEETGTAKPQFCPHLPGTDPPLSGEPSGN